MPTVKPQGEQIREETCPACGYHVAVQFLEQYEQPLATLAWPSSAKDATSMPELSLDFVRCVQCGHVFNAAFDYDQVPYLNKPNLMFNAATIWSSFILGVQQKIRCRLTDNAVVLEIGHGSGEFLTSLRRNTSNCRFIGFDPHGAEGMHEGVEFFRELFIPELHLKLFQPDFIISRHVLEHLMNPLGFLQRIAFAAKKTQKEIVTYFEVPCIDRAVDTGRIVDFYYEHSSQFTTRSYTKMLAASGAEIEEIGHGYDGEVVFGFSRLRPMGESSGLEKENANFLTIVDAGIDAIKTQLEALHASGKRVAIWGGTGKSAAFANVYGLDSKRFPYVIDSDQDKVGTFVPGTGQEIKFRDWLKKHPVDVIIIPPQWRAADIVTEIEREKITVETILIEHMGKLIDFITDPHPYRKESV